MWTLHLRWTLWHAQRCTRFNSATVWQRGGKLWLPNILAKKTAEQVPVATIGNTECTAKGPAAARDCCVKKQLEGGLDRFSTWCCTPSGSDIYIYVKLRVRIGCACSQYVPANQLTTGCPASSAKQALNQRDSQNPQALSLSHNPIQASNSAVSPRSITMSTTESILSCQLYIAGENMPCT